MHSFQPRLGAVTSIALAEETGEALVALDDVRLCPRSRRRRAWSEKRVRLLLRLVPHVDDAHLRPTDQRQRGRELPGMRRSRTPRSSPRPQGASSDAAKGFFHVFLPHRGPSSSRKIVCLGAFERFA